MTKVRRGNRVPVMMTDTELAEIDQWRLNHHIATRSDAIRRLAQNALRLDDEVGAIMDQAEAVYDETHLALERMHDSLLQHLGRHKELPKRKWTVQELIDRELSRAGDMFDAMHLLYLTLLSLNNRVVTVSNAPHLRAGRAAAMREVKAIEKDRADYLQRMSEGSNNRRLMQAFAWLTSDELEKEAFDALSEKEQEAHLQEAQEHLRLVAERAQIAADDADVKRRKAMEPRDDDLSAVVAYQVTMHPDRPVEWHLERIIRDYFKDANPVVAGHMIRSAMAHQKPKGEPDVSSEA